MTIFYPLKVWAYKGWRMTVNAFRFTRPRTVNTIWMLPVFGECDYCGNDMLCATLEGDYETVVQICGGCLNTAQQALGNQPKAVPVATDHRGVIM